MKPLAIRNWLYDLHDGDDYHWETCSKTAGIMSLILDFVDHNEIYSIRNPMDKVTIPASEEEHPEIRLLSPDEVAEFELEEFSADARANSAATVLPVVGQFDFHRACGKMRPLSRVPSGPHSSGIHHGKL
jgi:hypothetical protein